MTRLSPITVGCVVLSLVVAGVAIHRVTRVRHRSVAPPAAPAAEDQLEDRAPPDPLPVVPLPAARRAEVVAAPADAGTATPERSDRIVVRDRQLLMAAHAYQLIVQADEHAFVTLNLADDVRVAIRRINEDHGKRAQANLAADPRSLSADEQLGLGVARGDELERSRRAAIKELLGPDGARDFATAEYAEARRLRIQYRKQWAEELDAAAPWPQGLPRGAH